MPLSGIELATGLAYQGGLGSFQQRERMQQRQIMAAQALQERRLQHDQQRQHVAARYSQLARDHDNYANFIQGQQRGQNQLDAYRMQHQFGMEREQLESNLEGLTDIETQINEQQAQGFSYLTLEDEDHNRKKRQEMQNIRDNDTLKPHEKPGYLLEKAQQLIVPSRPPPPPPQEAWEQDSVDVGNGSFATRKGESNDWTILNANQDDFQKSYIEAYKTLTTTNELNVEKRPTHQEVMSFLNQMNGGQSAAHAPTNQQAESLPPNPADRVIGQTYSVKKKSGELVTGVWTADGLDI